ncbi:hypothetical protein Trebr_1997 [Treponema brennaborense DSM 12168]|uniref:Uncharacterized protein n=2 Tax=Treponema TaxID=157 RepID=F4LJN3_TREBD|nr:hypothetical protein Trebr_1997 [Treponema brennaborense DSM 12168]
MSMVKKIFIFIFSFFTTGIFSLDLGFNLSQNYSFIEKTEYTPSVYFTNKSNFFLNFQIISDYIIFSASPSLSLKNKNSFLNFYRFKFDFLFENAVFSLSKNIYSMGHGYIYNPIIPQSVSQKINDSTEWYGKFDLYLNQHTVTLGALIDPDIDYYEIPDYTNPYFYYTYNTLSTMIGFCVDYDYKFDSPDISKIKFALDTQFFLKNDYSLYFAASLLSNFSENQNYSFLASIDKSFFVKESIFTPKIEFLFKDEVFSCGFNMNMDLGTYLNNVFFIKYSSENELKIINKASFVLGKYKFEMSYMTGDILKKSLSDDSLFILGVTYE